MGTNRAAYQTDLQALTLAGVARRCTQETELFFQSQSHDPRFCFELFRRAIVDRNQNAWELVYSQYRPLVAGWVGRHPAFPTSGEEVQYFVNRAFEKMWVVLTPDKFSRFSDLRSVLRYLKMCVFSVILDEARGAELAVVRAQADVASVDGRANGPTVEDQALARVDQEEFWGQIEVRLRGEKERLVVYASFVLGLKPREIFAQYQGTFWDVKEIYRIKENVLARLARDPGLKKFVGVDGGKT